MVSEWPNIERILLSLVLKTTTQSLIVGKLSAYRRKNRTKLLLETTAFRLLRGS